MKKTRILLTPGPTPLPPEVLEALASAIIHHRTDAYRKVFREATEGLKEVFRTKNDLYTLTASGTGAMEASVVNFHSPGDPVAVLTAGKWGERFLEIAQSYRLACDCLSAPYGETFDLEDVRRRLAAKPYKAVYAQLCETSTGVVHDIPALARLVGHTDALFVVDAVSGLLADRLETDAWKIDVVVSGSQKGLMLPPGLAFLSVNEKAKRAMAGAALPKYYYDLARYEKAYRDGQTPFTPAITLVVALARVLEKIRKEGLDNLLSRVGRLAEGTRKALQELGLELFAKRPSNAVTAVKFPAGVDGKKLLTTLSEEYGVVMAGGQGEMRGEIFRIAHLGAITGADLSTGLDALARVLAEMGYRPAGRDPLRVFRETVTV